MQQLGVLAENMSKLFPPDDIIIVWRIFFEGEMDISACLIMDLLLLRKSGIISKVLARRGALMQKYRSIIYGVNIC